EADAHALPSSPTRRSSDLFRRILTANPKNSEARYKLAEMLLWQTEYDAAQRQVETLLASDPDNMEARVLLGTIALRRDPKGGDRSEEHTSELQSRENLVCR